MEGRADIADFERLDIRVGRVRRASINAKARRPAFVLEVDFGPEVGVLCSSAQLTGAYTAEGLAGRLVLGVVNLPPRRVGGVESGALVLGVYSDGGNGPVVLIGPDEHDAVRPGDRLG